IWKNGPVVYLATKPGPAWSISKILAEVTTRGTAASVKSLGFTKPCAGKTGTTNDFKDAWFAGFTSSVTCAVWVGLDTPKRTIQGGYGSTLALPIWVEIMKTADKLGYKAEGLESKLSFVQCRLCRESGKRVTPGCEAAGTGYNDRVPVDSAPPENDLCPIHPARALPIDAPDGRPLRAVPVEDHEAETP